MAYKVSYKVVSEQGEQLKKAAKEMDNYVSQLNQIISKLGSDQLMQSVRADLKKFQQQLETERAVLDMAGGILIEVVQSYSGAEKKSVAKVDRAKAHNRDFYKRPVAVASAGGAAGATATVYASGSGGATAINQSVVNNTYNINDPGIGASGASAGFGAAAGIFSQSALAGAGEAAGTAAALGAGVATGGVIASTINEKRKERKEEKAVKAAKSDDQER